MKKDVRQRMSSSRINYLHKHPELKQQISVALLGHEVRETTRHKIGAKLKGRIFSGEFFVKKKNKRYITNGVESRQINVGEEPPQGWYLGRNFKWAPAEVRKDSKRVQCIETREIFKSIGTAERILNVTNIRRAIKLNCVTKGYHWQYVTDTKEVSNGTILQ